MVKIAFIQEAPVYMNLYATIERVEKFLEKASGDGADIVVFPETWLPGYPAWIDYAPEAALWDHPPAKALHRLLMQNSLEIGSDAFHRIREAVIKANACTVIGAHEKSGGTLYNTMITFAPDGSHKLHRKLMPTYTERLIWGMGDGSTLEAVETELGIIGGLICWEHWMPMARAAMHAQDELIHVAQWPWAKELHQLCSRHYAFEGQCFVAASGGILSKKDMREGILSLEPADKDKIALELIDSIPVEEEELLLKGGSALVAPDSSYVMEPVYERAGVFFAEADPGLIDEGQLFLDTDGHYSRPDVFTLGIDTSEKKNVHFGEPEDFQT